MSLPAALILAAAATASTPTAAPARGVELAQGRVTAEILQAAIVRQASGPEQSGTAAPRHQLTRRGKTILVEFQ